MDLPRPKSDSTRNLDSDKSDIRKVRNFLKDNQEMFNHGETSDTAKRTGQTNSRSSKDDSWTPLTATEKALDQLKHELPQLKATLAKNEAELQHLSGDRNKIVAQRDELMNMVKQKEALMLKSELDKFQQALKFPEDSLLDTKPLKEIFEASKSFLQYIKCKGINTQELGEFLQAISPAIASMEEHITFKNQVESLLDHMKSNIKNNTIDISSSKKLEIPQIENGENYSILLKEASDIYKKFIENSMKRDSSKEERIKAAKEVLEQGPRCSQLYYAMTEYLLKLVHRSFENFQGQVQIAIEEQIGKTTEEVRNQTINKLDEDINRTLETIVGPQQGKKQKQATRIKQAERVLQKQLEESEEKIQAIHHKNDSLKNKIHELEDQIGDYIRYNPKGSEAKFKNGKDNLVQIYKQEGIEGIKKALSISTQATDARSHR
jgi:cell division protein FtsB